MKNTKKVLILLLAFAMVIPSIVGDVFAKDLSGTEYIQTAYGLNAKFICQYNGENNTGMLTTSEASTCSPSDASSVFNNNPSDGIILRDGSGTWAGTVAPGDYVGAEFETPITLRSIKFIFKAANANDTYNKGEMQYRVDGSDEWIPLKTFDDARLLNAEYNEETLNNVKAVRLVAGDTQVTTGKWVRLQEIVIDGNIPGEANYVEVTTALNKASSIVEEDYSPESYAVLKAAVDAVEYDLNETEQAKVDKFAVDINNALDGLVKIKHQLLTNYIEIVEVGNEQSDEPLSNVFDENPSTVWHTNWNGSERSTHHFTLKVPQGYYDSIQLLHRPVTGVSGDENGVITELKVFVKHGTEGEWVEVSHATGIERNGWQTIEFDRGVLADHIKFVVVDAQSSNNKLFASLAELKIFFSAEQLNRNKWKGVAYFSNGDNAEYADNAVDYEQSSTPEKEGPAEYMFDGNLNTHFHTDYAHQNEDYYRNPTTIILKLGKQDTFNFVDWLNRADNNQGCRLSTFELYTIEGDQEYTNEQLKSDAPWVKKFATTAENAAYTRLYVGKQTTQYVKIVCGSHDGGKHIACSELNLYNVPEEDMGEIIYSGINANLDSSAWIKESAYDQFRNVKGYYGIVSGISNVFSNTEANLVRYIDSSVLSVKAQSTIIDEDEVNVRFITSIASYNLEELRFEIEILDENENVIGQKKGVDTHRVFKSIKADGVEINDASSVFGNNISTHFAMCKLNNIPRTEIEKGTQIKVTPYWAPKDVAQGDYDNYVKGIERTFTVEELFNNASQTETISEVE